MSESRPAATEPHSHTASEGRAMRDDTYLSENASDQVAPDSERYLTRREVAARCRVPLSTFDAMRRQAKVPYPDAHMGKHMLWKSSKIDAFLNDGGTRARA